VAVTAHGRARVAHAVTEIFAPSILIVALLLVVGWHAAGASGLLWGVLASLFCSLVPYGILVWGVARGRWTDRHVGLREQRIVPFLMGITWMAGGVAFLLSVPGSPRELLALEVAMLTGLSIGLAITNWWKVSMHTAMASASVAVLALTFGAYMLGAAPLVVLTAWSRVVLHDHTAWQTIIGGALGVVVALSVFPLLR
jgi:membrane-associated phospholipid phosphatase